MKVDVPTVRPGTGLVGRRGRCPRRPRATRSGGCGGEPRIPRMRRDLRKMEPSACTKLDRRLVTGSDAGVVGDPVNMKTEKGYATDRVQAAEGASTPVAKRRRCEGVASWCAAKRARRGPEAAPTQHG